MRKIKLQPALKESCDLVAKEIVRYAEEHNTKPYFGGTVEDNYKGQLGMHSLSMILYGLGADHFFDKSIGRLVPNDMTIFSKLYEVKTGKITQGTFEEAMSNPKFNFLVPKRQYDEGKGKGVRGYICMLIDADYENCAFIGWIKSELVPVDKDGGEREIKTRDRNGLEMREPCYVIPYSDLKSVN